MSEHHPIEAMLRLLACLAIAVAALVGAAGAMAQSGPGFRLGFKDLADAIPGVVGEPLENERHNPLNGDALQRTTTGLMAWRKADNWTAFTDGSRTWINGPLGVQARDNGERFPWERESPAAPLPDTAPSPAPTLAPLAPPAPDNVSRLESLRSLRHRSESDRPLQISRVAFSPDGRLLATAAYSLPFREKPTVKVWDPATGQELHTFGGHEGWILAMAFSPDGRLLASGGTDGTARLWDAASGRLVRTLNWASWVWLESLAFSPDGRLLVAGGSNGTALLWEVATGAEVRVLSAPTWAWVYALAFSPDGRLLAVGGSDGEVRLLEAGSWRAVRTLFPQPPVRDVAFSPDGHLLASASRDGNVKLFDVASGEEVRTLQHQNWVYGATFSPDGLLLASLPGGKVVYLWEVASGRLLRALAGHGSSVTGVAFSPDGQLIATADAGGEVKLWGRRE